MYITLISKMFADPIPLRPFPLRLLFLFLAVSGEDGGSPPPSMVAVGKQRAAIQPGALRDVLTELQWPVARTPLATHSYLRRLDR